MADVSWNWNLCAGMKKSKALKLKVYFILDLYSKPNIVILTLLVQALIIDNSFQW